MKKKIETVGVVAMPIISVGGGFAHVTIDLISALNALGKKVVLLTPFRVDMKKIKELYGPVKIEKIYNTRKAKSFFCREDMTGRRLIKKEFQNFARQVDFIIDMDGAVLHNFLPKSFNKDNYIVWRVSCINPETHKRQNVKNMKILIKKVARKLVFRKKDIPHNVKVYPLDEWTKKEVIAFWKIKPESCFYPEIKVQELKSAKKKKNQIIIFGRIAQNKSIDDSIIIFHKGTKRFPKYKLIILGGSTPDTDAYVKKLNSLIKNRKISDKVKIIRDPSFETIKKTLSESKILIDSQIGVSLTMTAIEAMASGCIVIARKTGGTYLEVLEHGKYGFGFHTIDEGAKILSALLKRKKLDNKNSIKRAQFFSSSNFKKRLKVIINGN